MGGAEYTAIGLALMSLIGALVGHLLSKKDKQQEDSLKELFELHKEDSAKLAALELKIAANHPDKSTVKEMISDLLLRLDERFDRIEMALNVERRIKGREDK